MPPERTPPSQPAHDVLAAEEFVVPAPDPQLHQQPAHDVLAAEEFVVPARDPGLHHGPVLLPGDPTGISEVHDVLAAEEFAMPAAPPRASEKPRPHGSRRRGATALTGAGLALLLTRRLRRRRA
jgi:hypothetical protein